MTRVRRAEVGDVAALLPLCRRFHAESPVHRGTSFDDAKVTSLICDAIDDPNWLALVALRDGAIVGMALFYCMAGFFTQEKDVGELTFYVTPEARGGRSAFLMLAEIGEWAKEQGAKRMRVGITTGINDDAAVRFYKRFGFGKIGELLQCDIVPSAWERADNS